MYSGYSTENETFAPFLQSFLQLSSAADTEIITLFEDRTVKIIPVALAKDAMQLKPGLLYDSRQGKLIGSTLNLNCDCIHEGEPDKETLKASMVQEAEVMCLKTKDAKFALPVGVNHLSKGLTAAETLAMLKKDVREVNVCLNHLKHNQMSTNNSVLANCCSHCRDCQLKCSLRCMQEKRSHSY